MEQHTWIDLRSDTVTRPTPGMLEAMLGAEVGDDVFREDPSVNALEERLAALFGKEAGLFCPSGTMTNQLAIRMHTEPGCEVICHREAHVYKYEGGGIAVNSHCSVKLTEGNRGRLTAGDVQQSINNPNDVHLPLSRLVCLEDTANRGGGAIYDPAEIQRIAEVCRQHGLKLHLDGARLFNALVETQMDYRTYARPFDSISLCLSKGLGTPVGSVLIGTQQDITRVRRMRKVMGGGMRQAGFLAAAGLYAIDHHIDRLKEDHRRARLIAEKVAKLPYVVEMLPAETNIVVFTLDERVPVSNFLSALAKQQVKAVAFGPQQVRMVTHLDIDDTMIDRLSGVFESLSL